MTCGVMTMMEDNGPDTVMRPNFDTVDEGSELRPLCDLMDETIMGIVHQLGELDDKVVERARLKARDIVRLAYATGNLRQWLDLEEDTASLVEIGRKSLELMKREAGIDY